jgi:hypothetical protein
LLSSAGKSFSLYFGMKKNIAPKTLN